MAAVEQWVLRRRTVVPANLALDVWTGGRVDNAAINLDGFLLELFSETVLRIVHILDRGDVGHQVARPRFAAIRVTFLRRHEIIAFFLARCADLMLVVLHVELDPA